MLFFKSQNVDGNQTNAVNYSNYSAIILGRCFLRNVKKGK